MQDVEYDDLKDILTVEANLGGDIYVISCAQDMSMGGFENAINTISQKIAFMEKVSAACYCEHENLKSELAVLEADIDEKTRSIRGMRGEMRIQRCIQRDPRWIKKKYVINEAYANYLTARGITDAYKSFDRMLEIKSNNMRKFPELRTEKAFFTKKRYFIKKRVNLVDDNETDGPIRKKIRKAIQEEPQNEE